MPQEQGLDRESTQDVGEQLGKAVSLDGTELLGDQVQPKKSKKSKKAQSSADEILTRAAERTSAAIGELVMLYLSPLSHLSNKIPCCFPVCLKLKFSGREQAFWRLC